MIRFYQSQLREIHRLLDLAIREFLAGKTQYPLYVQTSYQVLVYFHTLHTQLSLLVTFPPPAPEIYTMIESFFDRKRFPDFEPTAVYIPDYNFFELNAVEYFQAWGLPLHSAPDRVVVGLPYADYSNPLMWCALAHEMGHAFEKKKGIAAQVVPATLPPKSLTVLTAWAKEMAADQIGLRLMGSAYLNSYLGLMLTSHPTGFVPSPSHPQPHARIRLMADSLDANGVLSDSAKGYKAVLDDLITAFSIAEITIDYDFKYRCQACSQNVSLPVPQPAVPLNDLWTQVRSKLEADADFNAMPFYDASSMAIAVSLVDLLERGQPVSSYRTTPDAEVFAAVDQILADKATLATLDRDRVYDLLRKVEEKPATIGQILNAGWDHRWRTFETVFETIYKTTDSREKKAESYLNYLTDIDYRLQKSIESSQLHGHLRE